MPDVDEKWNKLMERMQHLPPLRNVNAIRTWLEIYHPPLVSVFDMFARDAARGIREAKAVIMMMMCAFAAGRAYQVANPDTAKDPDGYGG